MSDEPTNSVIDPWLSQLGVTVITNAVPSSSLEPEVWHFAPYDTAHVMLTTRHPRAALTLCREMASAGGAVCALMGELGPELTARCVALFRRSRPGQVLLNLPLHDLLRGFELVEDARDLGIVDLLGRRERLYVLGLSAAPVTEQVPRIRQTFIGRSRELEELQRVFEHARLLTVHGLPGVGKSELLQRFALQVEHQFPAGLVHVDLQGARHVEILYAKVQQALDSLQLPGEDDLMVVTNTISDRELLVVLDNVEQVGSFVALLVAGAIHVCPNVVFLVGSQRPLKILGEQRFQLHGLDTPSCAENWQSISQHEAVQLFEVRARTIDASFTISKSNARDVAELCERLDGVPQHIELAAIRIRTLTPRDIVNKLKDRIGTSDGVLDWAYNALSGDARSLLRHLSLFQGAFTMDWAQAVHGSDASEEPNLIGAIEELLDASFLTSTDSRFGSKFYALTSLTRRYGASKLAESGDGESVTARYAAWARELIATASASPPGEEPYWREVFDAAALDFLQSIYSSVRNSRTSEEAVETGLACLRYLLERGSFRQGLSLATHLAKYPSVRRSVHFSRILGAASNCAYYLSEVGLCTDLASESLRSALKGSDFRVLGSAWCSMGMAKQLAGRPRSAYRCYRYSAGWLKKHGDPRLVSIAATNVAAAANDTRDVDLIRPAIMESVLVARHAKDKVALAHALLVSAHFQKECGAWDLAFADALEALEHLDQVEDPNLTSLSAANCAYALQGMGYVGIAYLCLMVADHLYHQYNFHISGEQLTDRRFARESLESELAASECERLRNQAMSLSGGDLIEIIALEKTSK